MIGERVRARELAGYFLWLGATGFGGPAALADRMRQDLVDGRRWLTQGEFDLGLAIAAACPGPLAYQLAVFCGLVRRGVTGAVVVAVSFALVPFCLVVAVAALYEAFAERAVTRAIFYGVGPIVLALITRACWQLGRRTLGGHALGWAIAAAGAALIAVTGTEHVAFFLVSGLVGLVWLAPHDRPPTEPTRREPPPARLGLPAVLPLAFTGLPSVELLLFFGKVGCLVFGSGLVIVPVLYPTVVGEQGWLTEGQFVDAIAIGLVSPGPVVITATFIGFMVDGVPGAVAATVGMFAPAVAFTIAVAPAFHRHGTHPRVRGFVSGITAAVVGALSGTVPLVARTVLPDVTAVALAVAGFILIVARRWPDPAVVGAGALAGVMLAG